MGTAVVTRPRLGPVNGMGGLSRKADAIMLIDTIEEKKL
jgi:hypothetical protein